MLPNGHELLSKPQASIVPDPANPIAPLLRVVSVSKYFAGVAVLADVNFSLDRGEILMVVGTNGAGKSTLKNILSGLIAPDAGQVHFAGKTLSALSTSDADHLGIGTIHQELSLFENLSVAENIHLPHLPLRHGHIDRPRMGAQARELLHRLLAAPGVVERLAADDVDGLRSTTVPIVRTIARLDRAEPERVRQAHRRRPG